MEAKQARIVAVASAPEHRFSKPTRPHIRLIEGLGVAGDAHAGVKVQHRAHAARDPERPNLRQVHLIHAELFTELAQAGFEVGPGAMGENITTEGLDLLALPVDTRLQLGPAAVVRLTGLRNPCRLLDEFQPGLKNALLGRDDAGRLIRKSGVMAVVVRGGTVRPGDAITVHLPPPPHRGMEPV